jgi:hypothetical protein
MYKITAATPPPDTAEFSVYDLIIDPDETWVGEPVTISAKVKNLGDERGSDLIDLMINGEVRESKMVIVPGGKVGTVRFTVTEASLGSYNVQIRGNTGKFDIVDTGKHTLTVGAPGTAAFTINGKKHETPYSALLNVGTYTLEMPMTDPTGGYVFLHWEDYSKNPTRTISLTRRLELYAYYSGGSGSCPSLYIWNGTDYVYRAEVSDGTGYLGILDYFGENGAMVFAYSDPWDYIKFDRGQIQPRDGYYEMILTQAWDEISYIDSARLIVVDHLPDVDVFSTKGTYIYVLDDLGKIYTVSKNPLTPISAVNGAGEDVLPQISNLDGIHTMGSEFNWDTLELNLGDLSGTQEINLIVSGTIIYSSGEAQGEWASQFFNQPGEKPFPPPYIEVKDADGNWVRVPENRQFPLLRVYSERFVVNLTGLFPTNDYSLRINTFFNTRFDYIGVDITPQQNVIIRETYPVYADLYPVFETNSASTGNFTRYGDVTLLVLEADDKFVIGRQGDQLSLKFPADLKPVPEGMERDYFLFISCWFKVDGLPYLSFTVDPLPFHDMSCLPYPPAESYPYDEDHLSYLREYNTRTIDIP